MAYRERQVVLFISRLDNGVENFVLTHWQTMALQFNYEVAVRLSSCITMHLIPAIKTARLLGAKKFT